MLTNTQDKFETLRHILLPHKFAPVFPKCELTKDVRQLTVSNTFSITLPANSELLLTFYPNFGQHYFYPSIAVRYGLKNNAHRSSLLFYRYNSEKNDQPTGIIDLINTNPNLNNFQILSASVTLDIPTPDTFQIAQHDNLYAFSAWERARVLNDDDFALLAIPGTDVTDSINFNLMPGNFESNNTQNFHLIKTASYQIKNTLAGTYACSYTIVGAINSPIPTGLVDFTVAPKALPFGTTKLILNQLREKYLLSLGDQTFTDLETDLQSAYDDVIAIETPPEPEPDPETVFRIFNY